MSEKKMPRILKHLLLGFVVALPITSIAQVPRFDVDGYCNNVAAAGGGSAMIKNGCIDMEQDAYNELKSIWASVPARQKSYCSEVAKAGGGSYSIYKGCIDMESDATATPSVFTY